MPAPKKALFGAPTYPKNAFWALLGSHSPPFTRPRSAAKGEGPGTRAIPALLRVPGPATTTKKLLASVGVAGDTNPLGHPIVPEAERAARDTDPLSRPR